MEILPVLVAIYFIPSILAVTRRSDQIPAIFIINTFLGWTLVGWVVALAWAAINKPRTVRY